MADTDNLLARWNVKPTWTTHCPVSSVHKCAAIGWEWKGELVEVWQGRVLWLESDLTENTLVTWKCEGGGQSGGRMWDWERVIVQEEEGKS